MDTSNHICLICNQTIIGLMNYVDHFKSHALPTSNLPVLNEKSNTKIGTPQSENTCPSIIDSTTSTNPVNTINPPESDVYSPAPSPISEFIHSPFPDADLDPDALLSPKHCSDFFQSLELKSANEDIPPRPKLKAVQRLSILEDDAHAESLLPITAILSNLEFSSDEDESVDNDAENENHWSSDDERSSLHPPQGHTGGKWKPGEGPRRHQPIASKWRPGQRPGPACRKRAYKKTKMNQYKESIKTFQCNVCDTRFSDRISYSRHFGQDSHKEMAVEKKQNMDNSVEKEIKIPSSDVASDARKQKNNDGRCYCAVCKLYFDNSTVFSTHCETKLHKDATIRHGYREYRNSDGSLIRVDVNTNAITKQAETPQSENTEIRTQENIIDPKEKNNEPKETQEWHECNICDKQFRRKYEMARHLLTRYHRSRAMKYSESESVEMLNKYNKYMIRLSPFQCTICQFYFNRQKDFLDHLGSPNHMSNCADMLGPIMCATCKFKTHNHAELMAHLGTSSHFACVEKKHGVCVVKESLTRITCKFCGLKMHSAVRMKRHCELKHNNKLTEVQVALEVKATEFRLHKCPLCPKTFRVKSMLQLHFLKAHKNMDLFKCNICKRGFLDQRRLDNHLRTKYHAKRVIAAKVPKLSIEQVEEDVGHDKKKTRGRPRKGQEKNSALTNSNKRNIKIKLILRKNDQSNSQHKSGCRRSSRKRKKKTFPDEGNENKVQTLYIDESLQKLKEEKTVEKAEIRNSNISGDNTVSVLGKDVNQELITTSKIKTTTKKDIQNQEKYSKDVSSKSDQNITRDVPVSEDEDFSDAEIDDADSQSCEAKLVDEVDEEVLNRASKHIFSCTYCDYSALDLFGLRKHYNEKHPDDILTCQPCNQYFLSLKAYKIHSSGRGHQLRLREQSGETKMHKCSSCDKRFLQESACIYHEETVHRHPSCEADLTRLHKGKDLVSQLYGDHVKQTENLHADTSVSCPECGKFVKKDTLVEHLRLHTGERPYTCRFCPKSFAGRLTLRRHISSHLNMPLFICDECGKEFKRNTQLLKHIRQHDFEKKGEKYTCRICKAWFYTPEELTRHMKRHGERNFKCTWPGCNWTFVLSGELKSHMFTHTQEKKYLCDTCGFGASTPARLRRHIKSHEKTREFKCDYCPYKANCKAHLIRHKRIHSNSKPFSCPYCEYTCNTHENMRKHILKTQRHKGKKLYPCKLCNEFACNTSKEFKGHIMASHAEWLRENSLDSLAVFSGLYKRDEDFQKPKEGSAVIQVMKGRFFRSYLNPDAQSKSLNSKLIQTPKVFKNKVVKKSVKEKNVVIYEANEKKNSTKAKSANVFIPVKQQSVQQTLLQGTATQSDINPGITAILPVDKLNKKTLNGENQAETESASIQVQPSSSNSQFHKSSSSISQLNIQGPVGHVSSFTQQKTQNSAFINIAKPLILSSSIPDLANQGKRHQQTEMYLEQTLKSEVQQTRPVIGDTKVFWNVLPDQKQISLVNTTFVKTTAAAATINRTTEPWYSSKVQVYAPDMVELKLNSQTKTEGVGKRLFSSNIPVGGILAASMNNVCKPGMGS